MRAAGLEISKKAGFAAPLVLRIVRPLLPYKVASILMSTSNDIHQTGTTAIIENATGKVTYRNLTTVILIV